MKWTRKKPTEPGRYWCRCDVDGTVTMETVVIEDEEEWVQELDSYGFHCGPGHYKKTGAKTAYVRDYEGELDALSTCWGDGVHWYGPVMPPRFYGKKERT